MITMNLVVRPEKVLLIVPFHIPLALLPVSAPRILYHTEKHPYESSPDRLVTLKMYLFRKYADVALFIKNGETKKCPSCLEYLLFFHFL
jgi:hypothetical protein